MKIKLKVEPNWEIWIYESYSTVPIITNGTMIFGAYNVEFEMTANIWKQLPEEYKRKIYNNYQIKYYYSSVTNFHLLMFNIIS